MINSFQAAGSFAPTAIPPYPDLPTALPQRRARLNPRAADGTTTVKIPRDHPAKARLFRGKEPEEANCPYRPGFVDGPLVKPESKN